MLLKATYDWDRLFAGTRSVLTIHNIGYQGTFSSSLIEDLALGPKNYLLHQDDLLAGRINPLRHGILYADAITTVSPTHAREICTDQYGMGLQDSLRARGRQFRQASFALHCRQPAQNAHLGVERGPVGTTLREQRRECGQPAVVQAERN